MSAGGARLFTVRERAKQTRFRRKPIKPKNAVASGGVTTVVGGECRTCRNNGRDSGESSSSSSDEIMLLLCTSGRAE